MPRTATLAALLTLILALATTAAAGTAQAGDPGQPPPAPQPPPPAAQPARPRPTPPGQVVNVRVELTITDQQGSAAPVKKTVRPNGRPQGVSSTCRSQTFVPVGPVLMRSSSALKNAYVSLFSR